MSDCCGSARTTTSKTICPACGGVGRAVGIETLLHLLRQPWQREPEAGDYLFCASEGCAVVYFTADGSRTIPADQLRVEVGQKGSALERPLCYCFDIRHLDVADPTERERLRQWVIRRTADRQCQCTTRNPSGRCCLADFPK